MDILQNLQSLLGGAMSGGEPQNSTRQSNAADGLGGLLNPNVLGSIASALFANKSGMSNMGANAGGMPGGMPGGMSSGAGLLGNLLTSLLSGGGRGNGGGLGQFLQGLVDGDAAGAAMPAQSTPAAAPTQDRVLRMLRALVFAAKADGHIDQNEQAAITGQLERLNIGPEGQRIVNQFMKEPLDPNLVAKGVSDPQEAMQLYAMTVR